MVLLMKHKPLLVVTPITVTVYRLEVRIVTLALSLIARIEHVNTLHSHSIAKQAVVVPLDILKSMLLILRSLSTRCMATK